MSEVRDDRQYTESHEWVLDNEDGTYTMGISEHAQALLGDMVYIELPAVGHSATSEEEFCVVESVKAASDVYAPCELVVTEVNEALDDTPELVNSSCYDNGWLVKFKADSITRLMDAQTYAQTLD